MSTMPTNTNLEHLIAELRSADEAGVFARTQVDVAALVSPKTSSRRVTPVLVKIYERAMVALPLAACLGVVIGIASMTGAPMGTPMAGTVVVPSVLDGTSNGGSLGACTYEVMVECAAGPGAEVSLDCSCADLDSDGDVDLRDLFSYQQLVASAN